MKVILRKIGCHGNVLRNKKTRQDWQHSHKYLSFGEKNRENRSSRSWDSLLNLKKKKEITQGKIYSPVGKFAERAKLEMRDIA